MELDKVEDCDVLEVLVKHLPEDVTREDIIHFQEFLKGVDGAFDSLPTFHHFSDGMYSREMHAPKGAVIVGKAHLHRHLNFLMSGEITVWIDGSMERVVAPKIFSSEPGTKRVGFCHTDIVWATVHITDSTDLEQIEREVIAPDDLSIECASRKELGL